MSWFDMLMTTVTQVSGELLEEKDWRNINNWSPKYSDVGANSNFILNDFIRGFEAGKTYVITPEYIDQSRLPTYFTFMKRKLEDGKWVNVTTTRFTTSASAKPNNSKVTFTAESGFYYLLATNQKSEAQITEFLNRIKSITITEV